MLKASFKATQKQEVDTMQEAEKKWFIVLGHVESQVKMTMMPASANHFVIGLYQDPVNGSSTLFLGVNTKNKVSRVLPGTPDESSTPSTSTTSSTPGTPSTPATSSKSSKSIVSVGDVTDFWNVIHYITNELGIKSKDIWLIHEGNILFPGKPDDQSLSNKDFSFEAPKNINRIKPGHVITFSGTPACQLLVNDWREYWGYPKIDLSQELVSNEVINAQTLEAYEDARPYLEELFEQSRLTFEPSPEILAVEKGTILVSCLKILLKKIEAENKIINIEEMSKNVVKDRMTSALNRLFDNRFKISQGAHLDRDEENQTLSSISKTTS